MSHFRTVELQGLQHYEENVAFFGTTFLEQAKRDLEKRQALHSIGFELIEVPAKSWKGDSGSIAATLALANKYTANINSDSKPLPQRDLPDYSTLKRSPKVLMEAVNWSQSRKTSKELYLQEKLDGWRAYFVPGKGFFTRADKPIATPPQWMEMMKNVNLVLDGELWLV